MAIYSKEITMFIESDSFLYRGKPQILKIQFIFEELKLEVFRIFPRLIFPKNYISQFTIPDDTFSVMKMFADYIRIQAYFEKYILDNKFHHKSIPSWLDFDSQNLIIKLNNPNGEKTIKLEILFKSH